MTSIVIQPTIKSNQTLNISITYPKESLLIEEVINKDRRAQKLLYEQYAPKMLSVCRQYVNDFHIAEDILLQGFMKVFQNIQHFQHEGSFEGWIRKIMVRECLSYLRQKKELEFTDDETQFQTLDTTDYSLQEDLQKLIDELPKGCKYVFVLYAIEGYKHQEIAEMLQISEGTSKSQYSYAKKYLQKKLENNR